MRRVFSQAVSGDIAGFRDARLQHPQRCDRYSKNCRLRDFGEAKLLFGTFEAELRLAISGDASTVILDLGGVGFIDPTGMRSVVRIANHSLRAGGRLRLRHASAPVQQGIEWGGLEHLLPLVD